MSYDPFAQVLEAVDPARGLSDADLDAWFSPVALLERLELDVAKRPVSWWRRRPWRRTTIITLSTVLVLAGSAAAISLLRSSAHDVSRLSCFEGASLSPNADVFAFHTQPLATCQSAMTWRSVPDSPNPAGSLCVLPNGSLAAFPPTRAAHLCAKLGLAVFNGRLKSPRFAEFERSAENYFTAHPCERQSTAQTAVLRLIGRYGIDRWRVQTSGSTSSGACATLNIQVGARLVNIVAIKR
jgi:hypothetical protein